MLMMFDTIIIGSGPAGLSAALYAGRAMLKTLIIEKENDGGQILQTAEIVNYPGAIQEESGATLIARMATQASNFGVEKVYDEVVSISLSGEVKEVRCKRETYQAKTVIIAGGAAPMSIGCKGEKELIGRGISHCATCDGAFFRGLDVYVVGGGDAALEEAIFLTKFAKKVTIIHRRQGLRAAKTIQEEAKANDKISFMLDTVVKEIRGDGIVEAMVLEHVVDGSTTEIKANPDDGTFGIFVFIGYKPETVMYEGMLNLEQGYILTDENMKTNVDGVFAAGDIRVKSLRQVVTAVADGAIAAVQAEKYVEQQERNKKG